MQSDRSRQYQFGKFEACCAFAFCDGTISFKLLKLRWPKRLGDCQAGWQLLASCGKKVHIVYLDRLKMHVCVALGIMPVNKYWSDIQHQEAQFLQRNTRYPSTRDAEVLKYFTIWRLEGDSVGCAYGRPAADQVPRFTNTRNLRLLLTFIEHRSDHFLALPSTANSLGNRLSR